jgi:hypothetical protein
MIGAFLVPFGIQIVDHILNLGTRRPSSQIFGQKSSRTLPNQELVGNFDSGTANS